MTPSIAIFRERMYRNSAYGQTNVMEKEGSHQYSFCSQVLQPQEPVYEIVHDN